MNLIKGGGGHCSEKVIDELAARFVVLVDEQKVVNYLGETFRLPVEVDKFNWQLIKAKIEDYGHIRTELRIRDDVPFITDNGNYILDCELTTELDPYQLHEYLIHLTGVLETGFFLDIADQVIVGTQQGVKIKINKTGSQRLCLASCFSYCLALCLLLWVVFARLVFLDAHQQRQKIVDYF